MALPPLKAHEKQSASNGVCSRDGDGSTTAALCSAAGIFSLSSSVAVSARQLQEAVVACEAAEGRINGEVGRAAESAADEASAAVYNGGAVVPPSPSGSSVTAPSSSSDDGSSVDEDGGAGAMQRKGVGCCGPTAGQHSPATNPSSGMCRRCKKRRYLKVINAAIAVVPHFSAAVAAAVDKSNQATATATASAPSSSSKKVTTRLSLSSGAAGDFTIRTLAGGLTNQLYLVRHEPTGHAVVVRRYGNETGRIISRESEQFWQSVFLRTYGRVGRHMLVYEFLDGHRTITADEARRVWPKSIARRMAEMHCRATVVAVFQRTPQTGLAGIGARGVWAMGASSSALVGSGAGVGAAPLLLSPLLSGPPSGNRPLAFGSSGDQQQQQPSFAFTPSSLRSDGGLPPPSSATSPTGASQLPLPPQPANNSNGASVAAGERIGAINHTIAMLTEWVAQVTDLAAVRRGLAKSAGGGERGRRRVALFDEGLAWHDSHQPIGTNSDVNTASPSGLGSSSSASYDFPARLLRERDWLLSVLQHNAPRLTTAVCHNDLPSGNIMVKLRDGYARRLRRRREALLAQRMAAAEAEVADKAAVGAMPQPLSPSAVQSISQSVDAEVAAIEATIPKTLKYYDLQFIDFEYTRRNYVYFDIANHFNEYAGIELDFDASFPSRAEAKAFVVEYLRHGRALVGALRRTMDAMADDFSSGDDEEEEEEREGPRQKGDGGGGAEAASQSRAAARRALLLEGIDDSDDESARHAAAAAAAATAFGPSAAAAAPATVTDEEAEEAVDLVMFFTLVSNFIWVVWSVLQEMSSDIDFDYLEYAVVRWRRYLSTRDAFGGPVARDMGPVNSIGTNAGGCRT